MWIVLIGALVMVVVLAVGTSKRKAPIITVAQAQAVIAKPAPTIKKWEAYVETHPGAASAVEQATSQVIAGTATVKDVVRFTTELSVYDQYVKAGGTKDFETFMIWEYSIMPAAYKAQILAAEQVVVDAKVAETVKELGLEKVTADIAERSGSWPEKVALSKINPEYKPTMTQQEADIWENFRADPIPAEIIVLEDPPPVTAETIAETIEAIEKEHDVTIEEFLRERGM